MSYNPQQSQAQEPSDAGVGYYGNGNPQSQNQNQNQQYANVPHQQTPYMPAPTRIPGDIGTGTGTGTGTAPYNYNSASNSKKPVAISPALAIGGGIALLTVIALVVFLVLKPGATPNPTTNGNANTGISSTSGLLPGSGVAKPASGDTGNAVSPVFDKTTLTGKVGETLRMDDYAVTVHTVKWNNVPANYQIKINGETRLAKPDEGYVAIELSVQRVSSTGIAFRSEYGVSTSSQYSLVDGAGTEYEGYGHPNPVFPTIKYKDKLSEGEIVRGWRTYAAPKALATDPNLTFVIETPPYSVPVNGARSGSNNVAKSPFYFKFKLAQ
jgi:hypothetical protein